MTDIFIKSFNRAFDLDRCISSIYQNVSGDFRIKVLDDGTPKKYLDKIRKKYPDIPIMATGGPTDETIKATIAAGANAVTWTPPTNGEVFKDIMDAYRKHQEHPTY